MYKYITSTTPGKVLSIGVYKPAGRNAYVYAQEGELGDNGNSFSTSLFSDFSHRVQLSGNNTTKNRAVAMAQMIADLKTMGKIHSDYVG